ncbi:restriction endonuclease [Streptomyces sp. Ru87]|uniref:restriction endonuclease n=1 Tax=Streptomyces sp. Ru87 TaxID=2044307 RepID=UPI0015D4B3EC|nr:restriction endonuclease [Streptomyces sp. Ru87]
MTRRPGGLIGTWAEIQRQQQRQQEAQQRAWAQHQRTEERRQRAAERAAARAQREQQAAYRQRREADARQRTEELDQRVERLRSLLVEGCAAPIFSTAALLRPEQVEPFAPGQLATPIRMSDPAAYQPQSGGWGFGTSRQAHEQARLRYEQDWRQAQAAEAHRQSQLEAYRQQYQRWAEQQLAEIRQHNAGVEELAVALRNKDQQAVVEFFTAALYASQGWPEGFPRQVSASYDPAQRQLVLDWELPAYAVVPDVSAVRYMPGADRDKETQRPATERRELYREVLAQSVLLALHDLFSADRFEVLCSVALNGFVNDTDPATGRPVQICLATVMTTREGFDRLDLTQVCAPDCLVEGLRGELSQRPDRRRAVRPARRPEDAGRTVVSHGGEEDPDLFAMDPIEFEELVAELFRSMGMQAVTTQRSNDGGVDVDALDPDPIRGGKIVVQVKRYRNTVPPSAVRDLYGTVQDAGANKGILITTSRFGPGAHTFANGKPLTLIAGDELVGLLGRGGLRGRLGGTAPDSRPGRSTAVDGDGGRLAASPEHAASSRATAETDSAGEDELDQTSVLGMTWRGSVVVDVCALSCRGNRVVSEEEFVFYNNRRNPGGSVRMMPGTGTDRAAIWVRFDRLPAEADRLVLVAAVDPETDPEADLAGFTHASIRLSDPSGTEAEALEVSDGRPGEKALVLGAFRRRSNGDWQFVPGGKGYPGGLLALVEEYGIEVR